MKYRCKIYKEDKHAQIKLEVKARNEGGGNMGESLMPTKSKNVGAETIKNINVMHERQGQHCCWLVVQFLRKHHKCHVTNYYLAL